MKMMYKIIIFLIMLFFIILLVASLSFNYYAKKSSELFINELYNNKVNQIDVLLNTLYSSIELQLYDYTVWDDIYYNLNEKNKEWMKDNATFFLYDNKKYNIDLLYITDFNNDYIEFYCQDIKIEEFRSSSHWNEFTINKSTFTSLQLINNKIYLLTSNKIYDNDMNYSNGYYTIGYVIDEQLLNKYEGLLNFNTIRIDEMEKDTSYNVREKNLVVYYPLTESDAGYRGIIATYDITNILSSNKGIFNRILLIVTGIFSFTLIALIIYLNNLTMDLNGILDKIKYINKGNYSVNLDYKNSKETIDISEQINLLALTVSNKISDIENHEVELIRLIIKAVEEKDYYTMGHSERVSIYSAFLAWKLDLSIEDQDLIKSAAIVHDIGKIGIHDKILTKKTKLTDEEYGIIKMHPQKGYNILKESNVFTPILNYVKYHHERYDGKGYPEGLEGNEIPLACRVLSIADTFDAITSTRPYRNALDFGTAIKIIEDESGKQFDPFIVDILIKTQDELFDIYKILNDYYIEKSNY